jgi:hypothetical protein
VRSVSQCLLHSKHVLQYYYCYCSACSLSDAAVVVVVVVVLVVCVCSVCLLLFSVFMSVSAMEGSRAPHVQNSDVFCDITANALSV